MRLIEGGGGVFEIVCDGELRFSKKQLLRFPTEAEVTQMTS